MKIYFIIDYISEGLPEMITKEVIIKSQSGFGPENIALFIQKASNFKSSICIEKNERKANAKSLLGLMSLSIGAGELINLIVEGEDEIIAAAELESFLRFDSEGKE
jgi:phosphotransferase system HPr (HPr) family protein